MLIERVNFFSGAALAIEARIRCRFEAASDVGCARIYFEALACLRLPIHAPITGSHVAINSDYKSRENKWNFHNEVQYRNFNYLGDTEQLLIRFGLGYQIKEKWRTEGIGKDSHLN